MERIISFWDRTIYTIANSLLRVVFRLKITILTKHITPSLYMTNQNEILKKHTYRNNKHKSKPGQTTSITQYAFCNRKLFSAYLILKALYIKEFYLHLKIACLFNDFTLWVTTLQCLQLLHTMCTMLYIKLLLNRQSILQN